MVAAPAITVANPNSQAKVRETLVAKLNASFDSYERSLKSLSMSGKELVDSGESWKALVLNANILGDNALLQRVDSINEKVVSEAFRLGYTTQKIDVLSKEVVNDLNIARDQYQNGDLSDNRGKVGNMISKICVNHGLSFSNIADSMEEYITSKKITALLNVANSSSGNGSSVAVATPLPNARSAATVPAQTQQQPQAQQQSGQTPPQQTQRVVHHHNWNPLSAIAGAVLGIGILLGGAYGGSRVQKTYDQKAEQVIVQQIQRKDAGVVGKNLAQIEGSETRTNLVQEMQEASQYASAASAAKAAGNMPLYNVYNSIAAQELADVASSPNVTSATATTPATTSVTQRTANTQTNVAQTTGAVTTAQSPSNTTSSPATTPTNQYQSKTMIVTPGGTIFSYAGQNGVVNNVVFRGTQEINGKPQAGFEWTQTENGNLIAAGNVINVAQGNSNSAVISLPDGIKVQVTVITLNTNNGATSVIVTSFPPSNLQ